MIKEVAVDSLLFEKPTGCQVSENFPIPADIVTTISRLLNKEMEQFPNSMAVDDDLVTLAYFLCYGEHPNGPKKS